MQNPMNLVPAADSIPVGWGWFEALLLLTFICHLLLMNTLLGGTIISFLYRKMPPSPAGSLTDRMPVVLALTVNLGVPPLLFVQVLYGQFLYVSATLSAVFWMALVWLVMFAYGLLYYHKHKTANPGAPGTAAAPLLLAACALILVSLAMTNVMSMMLMPDVWAKYFQNPQGTVANIGNPTFLPRWLHFLSASLAVGGLVIALLNQKAAGLHDAAAASWVTTGMKWFSYATLAQMAAGLWWLFSLPQNIMLQFMGGKALNTAIFVAGLAAAGAAVVFGFQGKVWKAAASVLATIAVMAVMRDLLRMAYLEHYFNPSQLTVTGQYSPMALFLGSFVLSGAIVVYMLRLHGRAGGGY